MDTHKHTWEVFCSSEAIASSLEAIALRLEAIALRMLKFSDLFAWLFACPMVSSGTRYAFVGKSDLTSRPVPCQGSNEWPESRSFQR